jgi:EAL domain-containing protein (putative c-di-GMP-specific phosphodiesterase class I)
MYRAKEFRGNNYQFYTPDMNARAREMLFLENSLRRALENDELVLHYQPQVNLDTARCTGVEALIRWQHPQHGMVSPGDFIPLAEETGLIIPIGEWVLRTACVQAKAWQNLVVEPIRIGVNISARQFHQTDLVRTVDSALRDSGLPPQLLELELTESIIMGDVEGAIVTMNKLMKMGVKLAIDDFGSGYSSLSYLKRFPITRLKIDRSFIRDAHRQPKDNAITVSIITLAHNLGIEVIAEGIELIEQLAYLQQLGCDEGQGFFLGRPQPAANLPAIFEALCAEPVHQQQVI